MSIDELFAYKKFCGINKKEKHKTIEINLNKPY
jgi:hypothetical protein